MEPQSAMVILCVIREIVILINFGFLGDSGGGMVFKQGKQFYLRGIVSISIALQNTLKCDSSQFAVFVDAAKYTTWIKQNI